MTAAAFAAAALTLAPCLAGALSRAAAGSGPRAHPEDGPDIDLRIGIEADAVRVRATMNIAFVWELVEFDWERPPRFTEDEEAALREKLVEYYSGVTRVSLDGVEVAPVLADFAVIELEHPRGEDALPRGVLSTVGVRMGLDYPAKSTPREVRLEWGAFVPDFARATRDEIPPKDVSCQLTALGISSLFVFTKAEPELAWRAPDASRESRFLAVPELAAGPTAPIWRSGPFLAWLALSALLSVWALRGARPARRLSAVLPASALGLGLVLSAGHGARAVAASTVDEAGALAVFGPLHANIYRAFDYGAASDVYDALARSVRGELLDRLYDEVYRGLVMQEQGGAVSRVQRVRPLATTLLETGRYGKDALPGFRVDARWQVDGSVFHWGHTHSRTNEYRAIYTVVAGAEGWRIADSETLEQRRVESAPGVSSEVEVTRVAIPEGGR